MNKVLSILVALIVAAPLMAGVTIDCNYPQDASGIVEVYYTASDSLDLVRAFALDIELTAGEIVAITETDPNYWVYPGSIVIIDGDVNQPGTPVATGTGALTGPGQATLEMGSLYATDEPNYVPGTTGLLCKIQVSENCTLEITGNATRGNVVFESGASTDVYAAATVGDIVPVGCQCRGDTNDSGSISPADISKISAFLAGYSTADPKYTCPSVPEGMECYDVNGSGSISPADISKISAFLAGYSTADPKYTFVGCMPPD
jgi:hypothetical protein